METLIIPIAAILFVVLGFGAFNGKLKFSVFLTFAIGVGIFKSAGTVLDIFIPGLGMSFGCKCATTKRMKAIVNGIPKFIDIPTGLNEDCTPKT